MEGHLKPARAFSLVETIFSLSLIALVMMLVFNLFPSSSLAVHRADQELQASALAQARLEELRGLPFGKLPPGEQALPEAVIEGVTYRLTQKVAALSDRLRGLRVTVRWEDQREIVHELSQEAYVSRLPR